MKDEAELVGRKWVNYEKVKGSPIFKSLAGGMVQPFTFSA